MECFVLSCLNSQLSSRLLSSKRQRAAAVQGSIESVPSIRQFFVAAAVSEGANEVSGYGNFVAVAEFASLVEADVGEPGGSNDSQTNTADLS